MRRTSKEYDARAVAREYLRRFGDASDAQGVPKRVIERSFAFTKDLFGYQQDFISDPSRLKVALCSRRAGKTYACCYYLIQEAFRHPDTYCVYIALTRINAKRLMWAELKRANRKYNLELQFNNAELVVTCPNNSQIILAGANDEGDVDKLRGLAYRLVIIDEAASYGAHLKSLIQEVIEPALIDHDGTMALIGTPNAACAGPFYRASMDERSPYSKHSWTIRENPHIPHAEVWLTARMSERGWAKDHPVYLREWCGQWIRDNSSLIYKCDEHNFYDRFPSDEFDFRYGLGIDLGYDDPTAFVVGAFSDDLPDFYIVDEHKEGSMIPAEVAKKIEEYVAVYDPEWIVADTGGLGKSIVEEFKKRYAIPVEPAEKSKKWDFIELFNGDLATGRIRVPRDSQLEEEWRMLQRKEDLLKEDPRFDNHLADAALYCWRRARHYMYTPDVVAPKYGTSEYWKQEEGKIWEEETRAVEREDSEEYWESMFDSPLN